MKVLTVDMTDIYPSTHWAVRGEAPAFDTPDTDVYLEGRNLILLSKAAVYMARTGSTRAQIGLLAGNPFPDSTPEFFESMERALSTGLGDADFDRGAVQRTEEGRCDPAGRGTLGTVRADAVVHAATRRAALRPVQQVPGAA